MNSAFVDLTQRPDLLQDPATVCALGDVFGLLVLRLQALRLMFQAGADDDTAWALIEVAELAVSHMAVTCDLAHQVCGGVPMHGVAAASNCSAVGFAAPKSLQRLLEKLQGEGGEAAASAPP